MDKFTIKNEEIPSRRIGQMVYTPDGVKVPRVTKTIIEDCYSEDYDHTRCVVECIIIGDSVNVINETTVSIFGQYYSVTKAQKVTTKNGQLAVFWCDAIIAG